MNTAIRFRKHSSLAIALVPFSYECCGSGRVYPSHGSLFVLLVVPPMAFIVAFFVCEDISSLTVLLVILPGSIILASILVRANACSISFRLLPFTIITCSVGPSVHASSLLDILYPVAVVSCLTFVCMPSHNALPVSHIVFPRAIVLTDNLSIFLADHFALPSLLVLLPFTSEG